MNDKTQKAWFCLNLLFIANYTLRVVRPFIKLPIIALPRFFNPLLLACAYLVAISSLVKTPNLLFSHNNFVCALLFLTFPHPVILLPFFLLSIHHTNRYFLENCSKPANQTNPFMRDVFLPTSHWIKDNSLHIGRLAMLLELISVPLSFFFYFVGRSSLKTIFMLLMVIRHQYATYVSMKNIVDEIGLRIDRYCMELPEKYKNIYKRIKRYTGNRAESAAN